MYSSHVIGLIDTSQEKK